MKQKVITTKEILHKLNLNRNTFQVWLDKNYITPSIHVSTQRGESNLFSFDDVCRIQVFYSLILAGSDRKAAADYSNVSFANVGIKDTQIKYASYSMQFIDVPNLRTRMATISSFDLYKSFEEIDHRTDDILLIVINLLGIKKKVESLFK